MKCSFCKVDIEKGTGKMYIANTGKIDFFCGSKCEKNMLDLGRNPRTVNWTRKKLKD